MINFVVHHKTRIREEKEGETLCHLCLGVYCIIEFQRREKELGEGGGEEGFRMGKGVLGGGRRRGRRRGREQ